MNVNNLSSVDNIVVKIKKLLGKNGAITLLFCVVLIVILSIGSRVFWSVDNLNSLQTGIAPTAIVAFGMVLLLICGVFDLSVGSIMVLSGIVCSLLFKLNLPVPAVILLGLGVGAAVGLVNGFLVAIVKINPLIATIGTMGIAQGIAQVLFAGGHKGQAEYQTAVELPQEFLRLSGRVFGVYYMFLVMIILLIGISLFLHYSPIGRKLYLTGDNIDAAKLMGFNTDRIILLTYVFTGFLCAVAGILSVARFEQANRYLGEGVNVTAIISCILGGASMSGGRGSAVGTLGGVVCMSLIMNMFNLFEIKSTWQYVVVGVILMLVVSIDGYLIICKQRTMGKI